MCVCLQRRELNAQGTVSYFVCGGIFHPGGTGKCVSSALEEIGGNGDRRIIWGRST